MRLVDKKELKKELDQAQKELDELATRFNELAQTIEQLQAQHQQLGRQLLMKRGEVDGIRKIYERPNAKKTDKQDTKK